MSRRRIGTWGEHRNGELVMDLVPARGCRVPQTVPPDPRYVDRPGARQPYPTLRPRRLIPKGNLPKIGRRNERRAILYAMAWRQGVATKAGKR